MNFRIAGLTVAAIALMAGSAQAGYNKPYVGDTQVYKAKYEDTFVHLARDYNLGYNEMRAANPDVDPWLPGEGTELILPLRHILPDAPKEGVVINLPEMRLYAFVNGENPPSTFPIGVGREGLLTPTGSTTVVRKVVGPVWRPTPRMLKEHPEFKTEYLPGDPENPMGTHALYLGWPTYGIHGTNRPFGIGRRVSSGCIRMYPESITQLYDMIPVGTKVTVVNQPIKLAWIDDKLYLEAHPDIDQATQMEETGHVNDEKLTDNDMREILKVAGPHKDYLHWAAIRKAIRERNGYPVVIARRLPSGEVVASTEDDAFPVMTRKPDEHDTHGPEDEVFEAPDGTVTIVDAPEEAAEAVVERPVKSAKNEPVNPRTLNQ